MSNAVKTDWAKPETAEVRSPFKLLAEWEEAAKRLAEYKELESKLRMEAFATFFPQPVIGTNNYELQGDYKLEGVRKQNHTVKKPVEFKGDTVDAVNGVIDDMEKLGERGKLIAKRIFKWKPEISVTEYKLLYTDADEKDDKVAQRLLSLVNRVVEIKDAAPTLEIVAPKARK